MFLHKLPAGLTALCLTSLAQAANVCFYPSGDQSTDVPCNPNAEVTMCCSSQNACLPTGLCADIEEGETDPSKFIRPTCTDNTWSSPSCPQYCVPSVGLNGTDFNLNLSQDDVHVRQCNVYEFEMAPRFCCGFKDESSQCCEVPGSLFELSKAVEAAVPVLGPQIVPADPSLTPSGAPAGAATSSPEDPDIPGPGSSDGSTPSTDPPSLASSPSASASTTDGKTPSTDDHSSAPTPRPSSEIPPAIADATPRPAGSSGQVAVQGAAQGAASANEDEDSSRGSKAAAEEESVMKLQRFNTGAVVGIGLGASIAGAGMVTIGVYFFVWRRLYLRQRQRYLDHMQTQTKSSQYPPPPPPTQMAMQGPDGKPATMMMMMRQQHLLQQQTTWDSESGSQSVPLMPPPYTLQTAGISTVRYADSVTGQSPVSVHLKELGWDNGSPASDRSEEERWAPDVKVKPRESLDTSTRGRTVTWLGGRSIYEMP